MVENQVKNRKLLKFIVVSWFQFLFGATESAAADYKFVECSGEIYQREVRCSCTNSILSFI